MSDKPAGNAQIIEQRQNGICTLRFCNGKRNALSIETLKQLESVLASVAVDASVQKVLFTGSGNAFLSGADIDEIANVDAASARDFACFGQAVLARIDQLTVETVSFINGSCYGGGLDLALACKRRIASPNATFCHPGARLGIITGWGGTQRLPRLVGQANALKMFLTAEPIDANEAFHIGLVDEIVADLSYDRPKTIFESL